MRHKKEKKHLVNVLVDELLLKRIDGRRKELGHHWAIMIAASEMQDTTNKFLPVKPSRSSPLGA